MGESLNKRQQGLRSVLPVGIFIFIFLGAGIVCSALGYEKPFSRFPACLSAYISLLIAFFGVRGSFSEKFDWMLGGIAKPSMAVLISVLALSCAFSEIARASGGVDSIVGLCLNYIPGSVITACFFMIGCLISFASGSSLSSVVAMGPIVLKIAAKTNIAHPLAVACVMGAAVFGNSISPISDCTIVSNSIIGIGTGKAAKQKLISQLKLYAVPFVLTVVLLVIFGKPSSNVILEEYSVNIWSVFPYILILTLAIKGVNFILALSSGIIFSLLLGVFQGQFTILEGSDIVAEGMYGSANMILLFVFMAGTIGIAEETGGIVWITNKLTKLIRGPKSAQLVIFLLSILITCCVGNDTIPMVTVGEVIKDISRKYRIDPRRTASLLPVATAGTVAFLPYSGISLTMESLIRSNDLACSFIESVPYNWFVLLIFVFTILTIFYPFSEGYLKSDPWDFEKWCPRSEL